MLLDCKTAANQPNNNNKINPGSVYHFYVILLVKSITELPSYESERLVLKRKSFKEWWPSFFPYYHFTLCLGKR